MFHVLILFQLYWCRLTGVFGVETSETLSITEGDSINLQSNVTTIRYDDDILWNFGSEKCLIAKISIERRIFSTFDCPDGRFRDRLKLDKHTGSLTITNTTTKHTGDYKLEINGAEMITKIFNVYVHALLPVPYITRECSSSSSCSVVCSVENVHHVTLSWLKGNSVLSSISVSDLSISLSLPLEVEDQEKNTYSCEINNTITHQNTLLNISEICRTCPDQGLPLFHIVLISASAGSLLIISAVVIFCIWKKCRKTAKTKDEDRADLALCKTTPRKKKSKNPVYENVSKK